MKGNLLENVAGGEKRLQQAEGIWASDWTTNAYNGKLSQEEK
jgi:hypothetical protein